MLMGEYHHSIDEKGRLIIPSKFRYDLGDEIIVTRGLDKCLFIYSKTEWEKITNKLASLPFTKGDVRNFNRFFLGGASTSEFDKQGRINITSPLVRYANLTKNCVIIGVNEHIEVWAEDAFNSFMESNLDAFADIAENLFTGGENA